MGGLILGAKSSFSQDLTQEFINTGTIHIVALSGYNVTIVAQWLMKLLGFLPRALSTSVGVLAIWLFIIMTGGSSTAIRSGVMATLALLARVLGRNYNVSRALLLAAVAMVLLSPMTLVYDVSFQLSFLAAIAVIFFTPKVERFFLWLPKTFGLRDVFSVTTAAYLFVMPFILYKMGNLSLSALPANFMILPFIPFTMILGFLTGAAGLISQTLSIPIGYLAYYFLHYELGVINFFAQLKFSAIYFANFPLILTLAIYAGLFYYLFAAEIRKFFTEPS
jgi:competence protein ComEC